MNICQKIKTLLTLTNKKNTHFAAHIGVSRATIYYWFNKGGLPTIDYAPSIASFFNISLDYLFSEEIPECIEDIPFLTPVKPEAGPASNTHSASKQNNIAPSAITVNMQKKRADGTNAPSPDTEELLNIYVELEPMGKHIVIAEAYNQYNNQLREKARHN